MDLAPEPITESEEEEATPEQLARLEQLQKQIQELESPPEPITESEEEEATPEQLARLEQSTKANSRTGITTRTNYGITTPKPTWLVTSSFLY